MTANELRDDFDRWFKNQVAEGDLPPIHAATVVVMRDTPHDEEDGVEILMMRKNADITFGGAWVFPGGKLDAQDYGSGDDPYAASSTAAVREAKEEGDIDLDAADLVRYSHWMPPRSAPKRFSTWFFLAGTSVGDITIDDGEITDAGWVRPGAMLDRHTAGEVDLAPPTWITLWDLNRHATVADALEAAGAATPEFFVTRIGRAEEGPVAMWTGDAGYETADLAVDGPRHRLAMRNDGWVYERTT